MADDKKAARRKELEAELAALDKPDDDESDEVQLSFSDGSSFVGSFKRARSVAKARGFALEPDPEPEEGGEGDDKDKPDKPIRFGRRVG